MRVIVFGSKCPYCKNVTRKKLHREGILRWLPFIKRYACRWCYGSYTTFFGIISIGIK